MSPPGNNHLHDEVFSESEVNAMLEAQRINIRMDDIAGTMQHLRTDMAEHMRDEDHNLKKIEDILKTESKERTQCKMDLLHEMHTKFVKKEDLRSYFIIASAAISVVVGGITFFGQMKSDQTYKAHLEGVLNRIEIIAKKEK